MFRGAGFNSLEEFCTFGVGTYVSWFLCHISKSWFLCHFPASAPANHLNLMKYLVALSSALAKGALKRLCRQLCYLSEEAIALAFGGRSSKANLCREIEERFFKRDISPFLQKLSFGYFRIL